MPPGYASILNVFHILDSEQLNFRCTQKNQPSRAFAVLAKSDDAASLSFKKEVQIEPQVSGQAFDLIGSKLKAQLAILATFTDSFLV